MEEKFRLILLFFPVFLFSLSFHEAAHAWMANRLGDATAKFLGRMTLNPLAHIDWIGTIVFPLMMFLRSKGEDMKMMLAGSLSMIIGIFVMRYDLVIVGQIVPVYHELGVNEYKHLLSYVPSLYETVIALGGFGITAFLFLLGEKLFAGHKVAEYH